MINCHRYLYLFFFYSMVFSLSLVARVAEESGSKDGPPAVGNFSLRTTQQPGPLFGFGQNINSKGDLQLYASPNQIGGHHFSFSELLLFGVYAFTDVFTMLIATPVALSRRTKATSLASLIPLRTEINNKMNAFDIDDSMLQMAQEDPDNEDEEILFKSSGLEDIMVQVEYAIVDKTTQSSELQTTLVGNIILPTGSTKKQPTTGLGSPAYFLGATLNYQTLYWYVYASLGGLITTKNHGLKFGNTFLYQAGCEGIIAYKPKHFIIAWGLELFGIRTQRDIIFNQENPDSGSHILFIAPSLWFSTNHFTFQIGVGVPVFQHITRKQNKTGYFFNTNIAWTFSLT